MKKQTSLVLVLILSLVLLISACSSSAPAPAANGKSDAGSSNVKGLLADIKKRGTIVIATSGNNAPTIFPNEKNELVGIDAEWAKIIADHLGVKIEWKRMDFSGIIPGLMTGNFDIGLSGIGVTEERLKTLDFSEHIAYDEVVAVYNKKTTGINSPEDIKGRIVGVVTGSSNGDAPARKIGGYKELKTYPGQAEAFHDLQNGRIEVMVTGKMLAGHWIKTEGKDYMVSPKGLEGRKLAVAMKQGEPDLKNAINEAILAAKKQGKYEEIAQKWLGSTFSQ
ncbi:polar amino acid transport system substrate-binding protein [Paenibacillus sp. 1_12]|uniref:substrate-binding periplasmic protein n=1 Tax=Paenibacillus sp. 1_12 TaxID=1566278 RepID=UPI0008E1F20E|nr:ABC transporter substrate-binding protein [Paenibacillus sp. 1_12]SFK68148.1 polar amino acid transport system substrate-binding protein [Paenibacillus sp. 1_12]